MFGAIRLVTLLSVNKTEIVSSVRLISASIAGLHDINMSTKLVFTNTLTKTDPQVHPVLIIGQVLLTTKTNHINSLNFLLI